MCSEARSLATAVEKARAALLEEASSLSEEQAAFKPAEGWSASEILEHLYLAELSGVSKVWSASEDFRVGKCWAGDRPNRGEAIEQVVRETWREREVAPPIAAPHIGGPLRFWLSALASLKPVLADLVLRLDGLPLDQVVFPQFLSGPLDARQRLEFLRFHIERHAQQMDRLRRDSAFPRVEA